MHKKNVNHTTAADGNIFADLGLDDAGDLLAKTDLALAVTREIRRRGLTQNAAADLTGLTQADISRISNGKIETFGQERLLGALRHLGMDVEIVVRQHGSGKMIVRELV